MRLAGSATCAMRKPQRDKREPIVKHEDQHQHHTRFSIALPSLALTHHNPLQSSQVAASKARVKSPKPLQTFVDEDGMVVVSTQGEADGGSEWTKEEAVGAAEVVEDSGSSSAGDLIEFDPDAMEVDSSGNNKSLTESMESLVQGLLDWNSMGVEGWTNNS